MRRRRLIAVLALLGLVVLAALKVLEQKGGKTEASDAGGSKVASHGSGSSKAHSELVRNARPQPGWVPHTGPVPILVYHALGTPPPSEAYPGLYVSPREFREEMAWLARNGYQGVTLDEVERAWYEHGTLPPKPIVITFDNGYPPQVRFAPSVLDGYGWPAVLFEITVEHLTPPYIKPIIAKGWEVDSHSATHPDLTTMSGAELAYQVAGSRRFLQRTYHVPSNNFCYPSSLYDSATIAAVRAAGYTGAVTEHSGYASRARPYELNRYEIEGGQGVAGLASDLSSPG
jgi:peptidoglycan/xylan/chitin deacetylase (PgdA/CDA1 family)